jgi:hypothetical protein
MKDWPQRGSRYVLLLGLAPFLHGCMTIQDVDGQGRRVGETVSRFKRESMLRTAWRGRPYQSLVEAFGTPRMVMTVPGYRPIRTEVIVYGTTDKVSNCIDAFTVIRPGSDDEVTVTDYFCR